MAIFIFSRFLEVVSEKAPFQTYLQSFGISHWLMPWVEFKVPVRCLGLYGALSCFLQWDVSVSLFPPSMDQRLLPARPPTPPLGHQSVWRASAQRLLWQVSPFPLTRTGRACLVHPWALMPPPAVSGAQGLATTVTSHVSGKSHWGHVTLHSSKYTFCGLCFSTTVTDAFSTWSPYGSCRASWPPSSLFFSLTVFSQVPSPAWNACSPEAVMSAFINHTPSSQRTGSTNRSRLGQSLSVASFPEPTDPSNVGLPPSRKGLRVLRNSVWGRKANKSFSPTRYPAQYVVFALFKIILNFPSGPVVKNLPANVENVGLIPGLGKFHMLLGN